MNWTARRYQPEDDSRIIELLSLGFPAQKRYWENSWQWVNKANPLGFHGTEGDIWVAESTRGDIVGCHTIIRCPFWFFGRRVIGAQGIQTATHPEFRRQGILETLASSTFQDAHKNGVEVIFIFPNRFTYPFLMKHHWIDYGLESSLYGILDSRQFADSRFHGFKRPLARVILGLQNSPKFIQSNEPSRGITIRKGIFGDAFSVWESVRSGYDLGIERTTAYLNWRYNSSWGNYEVFSALENGETVGYAVWKRVDEGGVTSLRVCEILSRNDDEGVYHELIQFSVSKASSDGAAYVVASAGCSNTCVAVLKKWGFINLENTFRRFVDSSSSHLTLYCFDESVRPKLSNFKWYRSTGDGDTT